MHFEVELAEVLILKVPDQFFDRISGQPVEESHIVVEKVNQVRYPKIASGSPVTMKLKMGEYAHLYSQQAYSLTNWMIDMGGISKAIYFTGMILAHIVALRMYKAALISDMYMVQDEEHYMNSSRLSKPSRRNGNFKKKNPKHATAGGQLTSKD